jgi:hypothetical protein
MKLIALQAAAPKPTASAATATASKKATPACKGLGCSSARASGYGSVIDHVPDVKLGF